ncbi:ATP-binding protein [Streptomyces sp. NPDC001571]
MLFERDEELILFDSMLNDLCGRAGEGSAPNGGLLAIAGSAGLGKTTLVAEVRRKAAARGCTLLAARGSEQEEGVAFHVVRQLVQPVLAASSEEEHRKILGSWYDIVAPAVGLVAGQSGVVPDPQGVRDGLDWLVTRFAVQYAPVVLVVDDAHWADEETLAWLTSFALRASDLPLLIVVAYRPEELPRHAAEFRRLATRHGSRPLDLAPFTPAAVSDLVRDVLGEGGDELFARECWALTAGNPYEAVELVARIRDRGIKPQYANATELRELASAVRGNGLIERLERLGPSAFRLTWAVAVLGTDARREMAAGVAGLGAEELADAIDKLRDARILAPASEHQDRLDFFHPLVGTAVYRAIPSAMRVAMHGQAAFAVSEAGLGATSAARHILEMHPENDRWAVRQLRAAARDYLRAGAPDAARRCLARALREPPTLEERAEVLFELGCSALLNEPATTVNHLKAALEEPELAPELREAVTYRLAQALAHTDRLSEAAAVVGAEAKNSTSARTRLRMQAESFQWNAFRADEEDSPARSRSLARLAEHLSGRGKAERYILGLRAWDAMVRGEPAETALHYAEESLKDGLPWTDDNWGFEVPVLVALTFMYCDQPGRADDLFTQGIADCERKGWRGAHLSFGLTLLGYIKFHRGLRTDAEERLRAVGRRLEPRGMRNPMWCPWRPLLAQTIAHTDPVEAAAIAQEGIEIARRFGTPGAVGRALHAAAKVTSGADSLALMAEAVRQLERSPAAYELAQALVDHGAMLSRAGLPQDAADLLMRGLESAALCGADALAARAREELAASGLRPLQLRAVDSDSLTSQEKAVAERAAQGWENRRIAEELGTKERTVELLLSGAFRKLGTNRDGLAGLLPRQPRGSGVRGVPGS